MASLDPRLHAPLASAPAAPAPARPWPPDKEDYDYEFHPVAGYFVNRLGDLLDIFRVRVRVGPGVALHARMTRHAIVYMGTYNSVYAGLPGPRMAPRFRGLYGYEEEKGLMLLDVDATDDLENEPNYSPTEFNLGAHFLVVGAELGFDIVELGDFVLGLFGVDAREDDR